MAKSKNDLNIHFEGKTDGLVVKLNGKVIYPYQEEKIVKEINPNKLKTQLKAGVAAVFSGGINRILPLRQTWKRWPVKSRVPYRNILAANIKRCTEEHPTRGNMICPHSGLNLRMIQSEIEAERIRIDVGPLAEETEFNKNENKISLVGIMSVFSPRDREYESLTIYPLNYVVENFSPTENIRAAFGFSEEMKSVISNYEKCILYYTIVIGKQEGSTKRWFSQIHEEYLLYNDANGKFEKGVLGS
jgi:hypothetical protein